MIKRRTRAGVSLVELLIAIGVIAVGLSGVAAALYFGSAKSKHGDDLARAAQYSRMLIEIGTARNFIDGDSMVGPDGLPTNASGMNDTDAENPRDLVAPPYTARDFTGYFSAAEAERDDSLRNVLKYKRKIQIERVGASGTPEEHMLRMTVRVYWEPKAQGGKNFVETSAIVYTTKPAL